MNVDAIVVGYLEYLKELPPKKYYAYCYGTYSVKGKALNCYLGTLKLPYTQFKTIKAELDELEDYVQLNLEMPAKKAAPAKRKAPVEEDEGWDL